MVAREEIIGQLADFFAESKFHDVTAGMCILQAG
jgi:hypothetical protein